jgi:hypothetical protein
VLVKACATLLLIEFLEIAARKAIERMASHEFWVVVTANTTESEKNKKNSSKVLMVQS